MSGDAARRTADITVRPETDADVGAIAAVTRLAFDGRQVEVDMVAAIRSSDGFVPELSLVADLDGAVIGHCLLGRKILGGRPMPPVLQLGPLSVHPEWQRHGIGSRLVIAAQQEASRRGREAMIVLLGVPAYYPRFGFRRSAEFGIGPDSEAAMIYPLIDDLSDYTGTEIPH
ncbi:GNAT family N-acetyltransferase [Microlunatus soli]|uniref:Putative acetyltransferase n=1 Tax=Microlunatus soli TaxID=630515 RepID=A0A1H1Z720_9ACTN|nr:N-acetyltransferase [Microlunatus soli]SDT29460.1 putative acetyltransferase [Microlunatus soli]